jgi:hypothetical protein
MLFPSLIAVFTIGLSAQSSVAFAQYMGNVGSEGQTGSYTLEEALEIQTRRVASADANPQLLRKNLLTQNSHLVLRRNFPDGLSSR